MVVAKVAAAVLVWCMVWGGNWGLANKDVCPESFKGKCSCGMGFSRYDRFKVKKYTVNCTNTGFTTSSMLRDLPNKTEVLIFTGNTIPILPFYVLSNMNIFGSLETMDMSHNRIRLIHARVFHKIYTVKTLILDHNDLEITDDRERPRIFSHFVNLEKLHLINAFSENIILNSTDYLPSFEDIFYESELVHLKILHLEQNEIWSSGDNPKIFCQLAAALEQLHLGQNRLIDFDFHIDCLPSLRYINLEMNMIPRLSDDAMTHLDAVMNNGTNVQINLRKNPFSCDCRSKVFIDWLNTTMVRVVDWHHYTCVDGDPESNIGISLGTVHDLKCPAQYGCSSASIGGALSFFLVFTSSLLLVVDYCTFTVRP